MAKIKIILDSGESLRDAEDNLAKALEHHNSGEVHSSHKFEDPAMVDVSEHLESIFKKINQEMLQEIGETLDQDYIKDGN